MTKRVGMISLGCPKNLVDAEIMLGQLREESDVAITNDLEEADVVIVNTCGFIDAAKQESIDTILEVAERKGKGVDRFLFRRVDETAGIDDDHVRLFEVVGDRHVGFFTQ